MRVTLVTDLASISFRGAFRRASGSHRRALAFSIISERNEKVPAPRRRSRVSVWRRSLLTSATTTGLVTALRAATRRETARQPFVRTWRASRGNGENGVGLLSSGVACMAVGAAFRDAVYHPRGISATSSASRLVPRPALRSPKKRLTAAVGSVDRAIAQRVIDDEWEIIERSVV